MRMGLNWLFRAGLTSSFRRKNITLVKTGPGFRQIQALWSLR